MLYYRERKESINPQLRALKKEEKITKPLLGCAPKFEACHVQSSHSGRAPLIKPHLGCAPTIS